MHAAALGFTQMIQDLLERGADPFLTDVTGLTALDWARRTRQNLAEDKLRQAMSARIEHIRGQRKHEAAVMQMNKVIKLNQDIADMLSGALDTLDTSAMLDVLDRADLTRTQYSTAVYELQTAGLDHSFGAETNLPPFYVDLISKSHWTVLMKAAADGNVPLLQMALQKGATVGAANSKGFFALAWACIGGHRDSVFVLLRAGADMMQASTTDGRTGLMHAAAHQNHAVVDLLVRHATEQALQDRFETHDKIDDARTAVEAAALQEYDWTIRMRQFLDMRDFEGKTALDHAPHGSLCARFIQEAWQRCSEREETKAAEFSAARRTKCPRRCGYQGRADKIDQYVQGTAIAKPNVTAGQAYAASLPKATNPVPRLWRSPDAAIVAAGTCSECV